MEKRNIFIRFFAALWAGADGIRKVLHLVLILFLFLLFVGSISEAPTIMPKNAALYIQPYGSLVVQLDGDPYYRAVAELIDDGRPQTLVEDFFDALS